MNHRFALALTDRGFDSRGRRRIIRVVLTVYRRHSSKCPQESRRYRRCNCPCWIEGTVEGKYYRESLKTRNWERATKRAREKEEGRTAHRTTIKGAADAFVRDAEARGLRAASLYKYRLLLKQLKAFSEKEGIEFLSECDVETLRRFRESWANKNYSARKKLEALRTFFRFAHDSGWLTTNLALLIKPPKVEDPPTLPFPKEEFARVLKACDEYPNKRNKIRLKALVLLLRYSGLRITDAVTLSKHQIEDGILKLRAAKTGTDVRVPLPPSALAALDAIQTSNYYFGRERLRRKLASVITSGHSKNSTNSPKSGMGMRTAGGIPSQLSFYCRECPSNRLPFFWGTSLFVSRRGITLLGSARARNSLRPACGGLLRRTKWRTPDLYI